MTFAADAGIAMAAFIVGGLYVFEVHGRARVPQPAPLSPCWWAHRLGPTRWRRVDVPVVGPLVALVALLAGGSARDPLLCAAIGFAVAALAGRWIDPLPPVTK